MDDPNGRTSGDARADASNVLVATPVDPGDAAETMGDAGPGAAPGLEPDDGEEAAIPTFHMALARALQAAADHERDRLKESVTAAKDANVGRARERAAGEAAELRRSAEADIAAIQAWVKAQMEHIRRESVRRTEERRARLDDHLQQHAALIDAEIASVDVAVTDYLATLDEFFDGLHRSSDPSEIVQKAGALPPVPDLDAARDAARASALSAGSGAEEGVPHANGSSTGTGDPAGSAGQILRSVFDRISIL